MYWTTFVKLSLAELICCKLWKMYSRSNGAKALFCSDKIISGIWIGNKWFYGGLKASLSFEPEWDMINNFS